MEGTQTRNVWRGMWLLLITAVLAGLGLVAWFWWQTPRAVREATPASSPISQQEVVNIFRKAAQEAPATTREACLREKLGPERYAVIRLSPQSMTPEERFQTLSCPRE